MPYLTPKEVEEQISEMWNKAEAFNGFIREGVISPELVLDFIHQQRIQDLESGIDFCKERIDKYEKNEKLSNQTATALIVEYHFIISNLEHCYYKH